MAQGEQPDLFEILDVAVVEAGVEDRLIHRANPAACALLGRREDELIGFAWADLSVPDDLELWNAEANLHVESGLSGARRMMLRLLRPDGSIVHVLAAGALMADTAEPYFLVHLQDVSEEIAAQDRLRLVVENTPVSIFLLDRDGRVLVSEGTVTPRAAAGLRLARGSSIFETFADLPGTTSILRRALDGERVRQIVDAFGWRLEVHLVPIPGAGEKVEAVAAVATDVTDLQQALASLRSRSAEQAIVADLGQRALEARKPAALWERAVTALAEHLDADLAQVHEVDGTGRRLGLLARVDRRAGHRQAGPRRAEPGTPAIGELPGPPDPGPPPWVADSGAPPDGATPSAARLTAPVGRPDQPLAVLEIRRAPAAGPFTDQESRFVRAVAAVLGSAALRFRMETEIRHRSLHDGLTELPNRTALLDRLGRALQRASRDGRRVGVLFIDLDGFKAVNDTLGHQAGDDLLRATAARLTLAVRPGDVVGRLAGDEFAVLCEDVHSSEDLEAIADRIIAALGASTWVDHHAIALTGSVGLALSGPDLRDSEKLLNAADMAMYTAKRGGPGRRLAYDEAMRARLVDQLTTADQLRHAVDSDEMVMLYQPVRTSGGTLTGAEATPYWQHRSHGMLRLDDLLRHLPQASLRIAIDQWALTTACRAAASPAGAAEGQAAGRDASGPPAASGARPLVLVGVSGAGVTAQRFVPDLAALLADTGCGAHCRLCVEIPQDDLDRGDTACIAALTAVKDLGVGICVSEFGSGGAVGGVLGVHFDYLRLAGSHVRGVHSDRRKHAAVAGIIHFAHLLDAEVIAGGIENLHQLQVLQTLRCDLVEGPLLDPGSPSPTVSGPS